MNFKPTWILLHLCNNTQMHLHSASRSGFQLPVSSWGSATIMFAVNSRTESDLMDCPEQGRCTEMLMYRHHKLCLKATHYVTLAYHSLLSIKQLRRTIWIPSTTQWGVTSCDTSFQALSLIYLPTATRTHIHDPTTPPHTHSHLSLSGHIFMV